MNKNQLIKKLTYMFLLLVISIIQASAAQNITNNEIITIINQDYESEITINDNISITISKTFEEETFLTIYTENNFYKTDNTRQELSFSIKECKKHTIELIGKNSRTLYYQKNLSINCIEDNEESNPENMIRNDYQDNPNDILTINESGLIIGNEINIPINNSNITGYSIEGEGVYYKKQGSFEKMISFIPKTFGFFKIILFGESNQIIGERELNIINNISNDANNQNNSETKDAPEQIYEIGIETLKIRNSKNQIIFTEAKKLRRVKGDQTRLTTFIQLNHESIKSVELENLNLELQENQNLGIDDVPKQKINILGKEVQKSYAIDPSSLNFTNGIVTIQATGKELYKCAEWDFASQNCLGTWQKIANLIPGQNHTFNINSTDPGYAETGVASINTDKPIYHPGEIANIKIAVLDNLGFLASNADIELTITAPNGAQQVHSTNYYGNNQIYEISQGIYETYFNETTTEGNYSLTVIATGYNLNNTMTSNFEVRNFYEFDIIRNAPMSIDPWSGSFESNITITTYLNITNFDFTEVLPKNFTVEETNGGTFVEGTAANYIIWQNIIPNTTLSYKAIAPNITPDLYYLGPSYINYTQDSISKKFYEARPWYVAIDPRIYVNNSVCSEMAQDAALNWNGYNEACVGGTTLNLDDSTIESQRGGSSGGRYCGIRTGYPYNLTQCSGITNVTFCAEWWADTTISDCQGIWVTSEGTSGAWYQIPTSNTHCTNSPNPGVRCYEVTTLTNWTCDSFNSGNAYARLAMGLGANGKNCLEDLMLFEVTYDQDFTGPTFLNETRNTTSPKKNESVNFTINITDARNISSWRFEWNNTGSWQNISSGSASGNMTEVSAILNITANKTANVCYRWYANDSYNNWGNSTTYCFTVNNSAPTHTAPIINSTLGGNTTNENINCYPQNNFDIDNDTLTYNYTWYNDSGIISGETSSTLPNTKLITGANITCQLTPYDGTIYGTSLNSSKILILQGTSIVVNLDSPINEYVTTSQNLTFYFNVTGTSALSSCELIIDDINVSIKNSDLALDTKMNFTYDFATDATYSWKINCTTQTATEVTSYEARNITINNNNAEPNITLNSPASPSTWNLPTITFNCTATDDGDLSSITLYTNRSNGVWQSEGSLSYPGFRQTNKTVTFTIAGLSDKTSIAWNCQAVDYDNKKAFAASNYTVYIDLLKPNVTLDSPKNYWYDTDGNMTLNCTAYDNADITNITLYTNAFGSFQKYATQNYTQATNTTAKASFNITGVPIGTSFIWNCLAEDNNSYTSFAPKNYTITLPQITPYFAAYNSNATSGWTNPNYATQPIDTSYSNDKLESNTYLYTYNFTGIPQRGTLLGLYHSLTWYMAFTRSDDYLSLSYSLDATNWFNLDGSAFNYGSTVSNYPASMTNQSYPITGTMNLSDLNTLRVRVYGQQVSGPDTAEARVDGLYIRLQYSPPPIYSNIIKNDSIIYQNETVQFNTTWTHDIGLGCYIFYINQSGTITNTSCIPMEGKNAMANATFKINATPGSTISWYFWANNTFGESNQTHLQYFVISDANDIMIPVINSVTINPSIDLSGTIFNITANITDNIGVYNAVAEITRPNGQKINYTMTQRIGTDYWDYHFTSAMGGNHSVKIFANDGTGNNATPSNKYYFNVTAYLEPINPFYGRGETIPIIGAGFSSNTQVSINIKGPNGSIIYTSNPVSNANGVINTSWTIPSNLLTSLGNYSLSLNDTFEEYLDAGTDFFVIKRADEAKKVDFTSTTPLTITPEISDSDDDLAQIVGRRNGELAYVNVTFQNTIQQGYNLDSLILYFEHKDYDPESDTTPIEYWNGTTWATAVCSPYNFSATWTISRCDLTSDITGLPNIHNIQLRFNYQQNENNNGAQLAEIDFLGLWANWSVGSNLAVTIDSPPDTFYYYNFSDTTNNNAYAGETTADNPPPAGPPPIQGTEAVSSEYIKLSSNNANRWQSTATTVGDFVYQTYYFTVSPPVADISGITFLYDGYFTQGTGMAAANFRIFTYNYNTDAYELISADPVTVGAVSDVTVEVNIPATFSDYISPTTNKITILVAGDDAVGTNPADSRMDIFTDYAQLEIKTITTLSGMYGINITAIDGDGVNECRYFLTNTTGYKYSDVSMSEVSLFKYYNLSNTAIYPDGAYNLTANCTDPTSEVNDTEYVKIKISNTPPSIKLVSPVNKTNFTSTNNVTLIWNVTSQNGANSICSLYLNDAVQISDIVSLNSQNTNRTLNNLADGTHNWKVTCQVLGGGMNTSEKRYIDIDLTSPTIILNKPINYGYSQNSTINFSYTPSDSFNVSNCSLYLDDTLSKTCGIPSDGCDIINNNLNNFTVASITQGIHNWSINCTDIFGKTGNSSTNIFYVDLIDPNITLSFPNVGDIFIGSSVQFNYTVTDNMDTNLLCNITVGGFALSTNIPSQNGTPILKTLDVGDGFKFWNVTCADDSGRVGVSETWNFTVQGDPTVNLISPDGISTNNESVNFSYYVEDSNGLKNCSLYLDNIFNITNPAPNNASNNNFYQNFTQEKLYYWTVRCFDNTDASTTPLNYNFTLDKTKPAIMLHYPGDLATFLVGDVDFNFTATDNLDPSLKCNLSLNFVPSAQNHDFNAQNSTITSIKETGLAPGDYFWSIVCIDDAGNKNESETLYFSVGDKPTPLLLNPFNNSYSKGNVSFAYFINDSSGLKNCSLYINGAFNQTNQTGIDNGQNNYITINDMVEQTLRWNILCVDNDDNSAFASSNRTLHIDNTPPNITLHYPINQIISNSTITFNFTAADNNDTSLSCSLYIDGAFNESFSATSAIPTLRTINGFIAGNHNYSITCIDDAANQASSVTTDFIVSFGPIVTLISPAEGYVDTDGSVIFEYQILEGDALLNNCSLIINGSINETKTRAQIPNINNGFNNNFTLTGLGPQRLNWTVMCYDENDVSGQDTTRNLHIDWEAPSINLTYPINEQNVSLITINFDFTASDNVDNTLVCNMTFSNDSFNQYGVNATNGVAKIVPITGFYEGVFFWNVTCTDGAQTNTSMTQNFSVTFTPQITLQNPVPNAIVSYNNINFTYIPETVASGFQYCRLIFDGQDNVFDPIIEVGVLNGIYNSTLPEGLHNWTIFCHDQSGKNNSAPVRNITIDLTDPSINTTYPDGQSISNSTIIFNLTAFDNLDSQLMCAITVNSTIVSPSFAADNASPTTQSMSGFSDGLFYWNATCTDTSGRTNMSVTKNFTVTEPPSISLLSPQINFRTNIYAQNFSFLPTDNSGLIKNCTLILNNMRNNSNDSIINGTQKDIASTLAYGIYNWTINCTDNAGNEGTQITSRTITIDDLGPYINLTNPREGNFFNYADITFNWTPIDEFGTALYCNLSIDGIINATDIPATSGANTNFTIMNLSFGNHNYSVTCWDDLNNTNSSETVNFTINAPDAYIDDSRLTFNNSNPDMDENITISAKIENLGGFPVNDFVVEFWEGIPYAGTLIGNNTVTVPVGVNTTSNISWVIGSGYHNIFVIVNPGDIKVELNYTNNNATTNISVLSSNITSPQNNTWTNDATPEINFTLKDYTGRTINYTILVDAVANGQTGNVTDNDSKILNLTSLSQGTRYIIVQAKDYLGRIKNSTRLYINIDYTNATANFITPNNTWFNQTSPIISFNITDNFDTNINYSFYVNNNLITSSNASNNTNINQTIGPYAQGQYNITIETLDDSGNIKNYTITIYIDTTNPSLNLSYPVNGANFTTKTVILNITASDNLDNMIGCSITLDNAVVKNGNITNGSYLNHTATNLFEGTHYWNATCTDNAGNKNTSNTQTFNVFISPYINITNPQNNSWTNMIENYFYFNVTDETGIENCSLIINGTINNTLLGSQIVLGEINNISANLSEGIYDWAIMCIDNTTYKMMNLSQNRTLSVDLTAPIANITTLNQSWFNYSTPTIYFNLTDNMASTINYTFYVNNLKNTSGSAANPAYDSSANINITTALTHIIFIETYDLAGNIMNSSPITIYYDDRNPNIILNGPPNGNLTNNGSVTFNFSTNDARSPTISCNLTIDGAVNKSYVNLPNPSTIVETIDGFSAGIHYWNVTCIDLAQNSRTSLTRNFTVPLPDLTLNSSDIIFSNNNPQEREQIMINATIYNIGNTDAYNFNITIYAGNPSLGGILLLNTFIPSLPSDSNTTVNTTWNATLGTTIIFVQIDPPIGAGGEVSENDENNNVANKSISIGAYEVAYGNTTGALEVNNPAYITLYSWENQNLTGDNLYAADYDANIQWTTLLALSRNTTGAYMKEDFYEADLKLGMENYSDSLNQTYTINENPKMTQDFKVFSNDLTNVPIINSTNNSNFITGILWDYSDGNTNYNGTQDLVIISQFNMQKQGMFGTQDFEIKIPAKLRNQIDTNQRTVAFYTELK